MIIETDKYSGFCFGVKQAVGQAEKLLSEGVPLLCLGDIVHNHEEVERLTALGMKTIEQANIESAKGATVLIRTHGEPPSTYKLLKEKNNTIADATCPVVLKLQNRVKESFANLQKVNGLLLIYGKEGHPEVTGLLGQTDNQAIVVSTVDDLEQVDFSRPIEMYSQTTMPLDDFAKIRQYIENKAKHPPVIHDTICRQVANRVPRIREFAASHGAILFVGGKKSSNGKLLFGECKKANSNSYFISTPGEIDTAWFEGIESTGICGATSTPQWLMEKVAAHLHEILNKSQIR